MYINFEQYNILGITAHHTLKKENIEKGAWQTEG